MTNGSTENETTEYHEPALSSVRGDEAGANQTGTLIESDEARPASRCEFCADDR